MNICNGLQNIMLFLAPVKYVQNKLVSSLQRINNLKVCVQCQNKNKIENTINLKLSHIKSITMRCIKCTLYLRKKTQVL